MLGGKIVSTQSLHLIFSLCSPQTRLMDSKVSCYWYVTLDSLLLKVQSVDEEIWDKAHSGNSRPPISGDLTGQLEQRSGLGTFLLHNNHLVDDTIPIIS